MTFRELIFDDDVHELDLAALYRAGQELREQREQEAFAQAFLPRLTPLPFKIVAESTPGGPRLPGE